MSYFQQINVVGPQGQDRNKDKGPQYHQDPRGQAYRDTDIIPKNTEVNIDFAKYLAKTKEAPNVVPINAAVYRRIYDYLNKDRRYFNITEQIGGELHYPGCD